MGQVADQIAAIRARADLSDDEKRAEIYRLKADVIGNVIKNGDGLVASFIGRTFSVSWSGKNYSVTVHQCAVDALGRLIVEATIQPQGKQAVRLLRYIVNPPVNQLSGTESPSGAAAELLASLLGE